MSSSTMAETFATRGSLVGQGYLDDETQGYPDDERRDSLFESCLLRLHHLRFVSVGRVPTLIYYRRGLTKPYFPVTCFGD